MEYIIQRISNGLRAECDWDAAQWNQAQTLDIANFRRESSEHRPKTRARIVYDDEALGLIFHVQDRYVRCVHTEYQDSVCHDSCVEFFVEPIAGRGYLNFEFNCAGTLLLHHMIDSTRVNDGNARSVSVSPDEGALVEISPTLKAPIDPGTPTPITWSLAARIPYRIFKPYVGTVSVTPGDQWRANLYKCGDKTPRPHWASWAPIGDELNFHVPEYFGTLKFE